MASLITYVKIILLEYSALQCCTSSCCTEKKDNNNMFIRTAKLDNVSRFTCFCNMYHIYSK